MRCVTLRSDPSPVCPAMTIPMSICVLSCNIYCIKQSKEAPSVADTLICLEGQISRARDDRPSSVIIAVA